MKPFPQRVFSGVQPTGNLHLGNYLGAITKFVDLQNSHDCVFCVVDLHAITVPQDPAQLTASIREVTAAFIASGIDAKRHIVFNQSQVAEHAELAWVLNCVARIGWMNRMTQFKEKAGKDREQASVGLYAYPVLMAADILAYRATHVPVGEDQKQHLELSRDIAQKFNLDFAAEHRRRIGLGQGDEGDRVLSAAGASDPGSGDAGDEPARRREEDVEVRSLRQFPHQPVGRCRRDRRQDPQGQDRSRAAAFGIAGLAGRPEADNLVGIFAALNGQTKADVLADYGNANFSTFKGALAERAVASLGPIGTEMKRLVADPAAIDAILIDGAQRARTIARETMDGVKDIVGLVRAEASKHAS